MGILRPVITPLIQRIVRSPTEPYGKTAGPAPRPYPFTESMAVSMAIDSALREQTILTPEPNVEEKEVSLSIAGAQII